MGRPGLDVPPAPTARPLGGLPGPVWGIRGRTLSHPRLPALWAGCRGRCGASGVGRSPTPDCTPSGRAAGAGVGRPGWGALPPPTARPLGGLPGPVWGVRGGALPYPRLPALWAGCQGRCGASGVGRSPTPDCPPSWRAAGGGVGRPGSDALPPLTARPLGGMPGSVWGVRVGRSPTPDCPPSGRAAGVGVGRPCRALSHPRLLDLWAGCRGRCGASGVGRSPTPDCPPSGPAAGAGVGRPGSGALPPPTARPLGGLPGPVWGVRGRSRFHPRLLALWAGCRSRCGAFWVGRFPTPDCPPFGRAAGLLCVCLPCLPGSGGPASRARFGVPHLSSSLSCFALCLFGPLRAGVALFVVVVGYFFLLSHPPPCFFFFFLPLLPLCVPRCLLLCVFSGLGCPVPWRPVAPPPFFVFFPPPPLPVVSGVSSLRSGLASAPPPPFFFFLSCCFFSCCASAVCVLGCRAVCSLSCPFVVLCASSVLFLVAGVVGSWCRCLLLGVCWWLWLPGVVVWWCVSALVPVSGLAVAGRPPCGVPFPCAVSCGAVLPCGAVLWCPVLFFFFVFLRAGGARFLLFPGGSGHRAGSGSFLFLCSACAVLCWCACAVALCSVLSCPRGANWCFVLLPVVFVCLLLGLAVLWCLLVAPGVVSSVACCGVSPGAVLRRVAARCAAWRCVVVHCVVSFCSVWCCRAPCCVLGRCPCLGVLCLLAPCFVLSPRAVRVLLWCVAAWCCSPLCFVPCAPWGVVLCVSCRLRPVRCCCVARSPSVPCFPVLCPVVLCCPVLPPCWVCFLRGCGCTYLKNRCKIS